MEQIGPRNWVGAQVRRLRHEQDLTQEELVGRMQLLGANLTRGTLAKVEAGIRGVTDVELWYMAKALRTSLASLYPKERRGNI